MVHTPRVLAAVLLVVSAMGCSKRPSNEAGTVPDTAAAPKVTADTAAAATELRGTKWLLVALGDNP